MSSDQKSNVVDDVVSFCRMFGSFEKEQVCGGNVTVSQCVVLQTLIAGRWDVSALAKQSRVTKGAMTRLLDGLESKELVERAQDPDDGRRWYIELTKDGRKEAQRLQRLTHQAIELILSRLPKERRAPAIEAIRELRQAAEEVRDQIDCC